MKYNPSLGVIPPFDLLICILILVRVNSNLVMIMLKVCFIPKKSKNILGTFFWLLCACSVLHISVITTLRINEQCLEDSLLVFCVSPNYTELYITDFCQYLYILLWKEFVHVPFPFLSNSEKLEEASRKLINENKLKAGESITTKVLFNL